MTRTVVYFTDSGSFGGSEQVLLTLLSHLERERWHPVVIHHAARGLAPFISRAHELEVETIAVPRMSGVQGLRSIFPFVRRLRSLQPDVFHAHLTMPLACKYALVGAARARIPAVVATEHLYLDIPWRHSRALERIASWGIDRYIAVSHFVRTQLARTLPFMAAKLVTIHNGIDIEGCEISSQPELRQMWTRGEKRPIVLAIARLTPQKGIDYLIGAAARLPEAVFLIAGDGPERGALEEKAKLLNLVGRFHFLGSRTDIPTLLANSDLFVLPSLYEGLPLALLEAMASGRPIVASAVGGVGEAVEHCRTGMLVPPADEQALASAIRSLLDDSAFAQRLATAARDRAFAEFSAPAMTHRNVALYEEILHGKGAL